MKIIDVTVLYVDTLPAKIYLALLKKNGYEPSRILFLNIESRSKIYRVAKGFMGHRIGRRLLSMYKRARSKNNDMSSELDVRWLKGCGLSLDDISNFFVTYPKNRIENVFVESLGDERLVEYMKKEVQGAVLFTGGGILNQEILSVPGIKFIHIHPGIVPDIRGADCFFWSYLLNGKAGYSVFYMNEGIDTGDVLYTQEVDVELKELCLQEVKNEEIYLSILKYYDPALRIKMFIDLLDNEYKKLANAGKRVDLMNLDCQRQDESDGRMYFFMHENLRNFVIDKLKGT